MASVCRGGIYGQNTSAALLSRPRLRSATNRSEELMAFGGCWIPTLTVQDLCEADGMLTKAMGESDGQEELTDGRRGLACACRRSPPPIFTASKISKVGGQGEF